MTYPTRFPFRLLVWFGVFANAAQAYVALVAIPPESEGAFAWMYYGAVLPEHLLPPLWNFAWASFILGSVLFALGFSWARWLLLCNLALTALLNLVSGIYVSTALEAFLSFLVWWLLWVPFVLSFFEPCSAYFSWKGPFGTVKAKSA
jgi:hypothetical protein